MENTHFKQRENPAKSLISHFFMKPVLKAFQFVDTKNTATVKCVCNHLSALLVHRAQIISDQVQSMLKVEKPAFPDFLPFLLLF